MDEGFPIVAEEVRKLADQSKRSTGQIASLIEEMKVNMAHSIGMMANVKDEVAAGINIAIETEQRFNDISQLTQKISQQTEELALNTHQISDGVQNVTKSGENAENIALLSFDNSQDIAASAQEQLASIEEITGLSTTLSHMSSELQQLINKFKF